LEWVERVAALDAAAKWGLIDLLRRNDARVCDNAGAALSALEKRWGPIDPRTEKMAKDLTASFGAFSTPGRTAVLQWSLEVVHDLETEKATAPAVIDHFRNLVRQGLGSKEADVCTGAVRLVMHSPLDADEELSEKVVPLLKSELPEVRRTALLAVGLSEDAVTVEQLLPLLQDSDAEVRRLCETALRGRGLQDSHIKLAKLISDSRPGQRLQVLQFLSEIDDLDPGTWLMRLSQDPSPAVRAAAIRFAAEQPATTEFQQRMQQMSEEDSSDTVRQLAAHYLKTYQKKN
jgi:HEAT repeat protein